MLIKTLQRLLLALGFAALLAVLINIAVSLAATVPDTMPAHVVHAQAGPYRLKVSLSTYPARAGYALPLAIEVEQAKRGEWQFAVSSLPGKGVDATPIQGSISATGAGSAQGVVEITVQGPWQLHISIIGPAGHGVADIPIKATFPPILPDWSGWLLGSLPLLVLSIFLLAQWRNNRSAPSDV